MSSERKSRALTRRPGILLGFLGVGLLAAVAFGAIAVRGEKTPSPVDPPGPDDATSGAQQWVRTLDPAAKDVGPEPGIVDTGAEEGYLGVVLANGSVDVLAEVDGRVQEVLVRPGDRVLAGQVVAQIDSESIGHRLTAERGSLALVLAEVKSFAAQLEHSKRQLERRRSLGGLFSREELENSEMLVETSMYRFQVAEAEEAQGRARVRELERQLDQAVVRAPFRGDVAVRYLDPGALASRGTPLLRVVSTDASRLRFAVPPDRAAQLVPGTPVRVEVASLARVAAATVERRAPEIDAASEMVFVEAELQPTFMPEDQPLPPGAVARVSVVEPLRSGSGS